MEDRMEVSPQQLRDGWYRYVLGKEPVRYDYVVVEELSNGNFVVINPNNPEMEQPLEGQNRRE